MVAPAGKRTLPCVVLLPDSSVNTQVSFRQVLSLLRAPRVGFWCSRPKDLTQLLARGPSSPGSRASCEFQGLSCVQAGLGGGFPRLGSYVSFYLHVSRTVPLLVFVTHLAHTH